MINDSDEIQVWFWFDIRHVQLIELDRDALHVVDREWRAKPKRWNILVTDMMTDSVVELIASFLIAIYQFRAFQKFLGSNVFLTNNIKY